MKLFGDFRFNWTLKKSAVLFGFVELCIVALLLEWPIRKWPERRFFVFNDTLTIYSLVAFLVYVFGILTKNEFRFFVLPSFIQSFGMFLYVCACNYTAFHFHYSIGRMNLSNGYLVIDLIIGLLLSGIFLANMRIKYNLYERMSSDSQPEKQKSEQASECDSII